jgi:glycine/D-amino acid oxidase-like deaminating enzyme
VRCGAVVVAVDGGLEALLPELRGRVRTTRLQMLGTAPAAPGLVPRPVYARGGYDYWQQLPDGRVVLGGCRDGHEADEWDAPAEPTAAVQADLEATLAAQVGPGLEVTHRWAGRVGYTPDALPVLEQVRPGVLVAGGYCGHGNVVGALCGRAAAALALGRPSRWDDLVHGR